MQDAPRGNQLLVDAPSGDRPHIRPTTADGPGRWARTARPVGLAVVAVLVLLLAISWIQDRNGAYPGRRTAVSLRGVKALVMPPIGSEVDLFDHDGPIGSVGPWPWRPATGPLWPVADGLVRAGAEGGTITVDPGRPDVIVQADVFQPVGGAGLVFRWQDASDHFSVEVSSERNAWVLVRTRGGVRTELASIPTLVEGSNVGVTLTADQIVVAVDGQPRVEREDPALADATRVGLQAPNDVTRFDAFAVLAG